MLTYVDVLVAFYESDRFSFDMIIPLSMLNRVEFSFNYSDSITHGTFSIISDKNKYFTSPVFDKRGKGYLSRIQVMLDSK